MSLNEIVTKMSTVVQRADGAQVKIVAETMFGAGLHPSTDVFVLKRENASADWRLCSNQPHPDWRKMSVDEYKTRGRSEMLQTVTHGEILKVTRALGQPMSLFA